MIGINHLPKNPRSLINIRHPKPSAQLSARRTSICNPGNRPLCHVGLWKQQHKPLPLIFKARLYPEFHMVTPGMVLFPQANVTRSCDSPDTILATIFILVEGATHHRNVML